MKQYRRTPGSVNCSFMIGDAGHRQRGRGCIALKQENLLLQSYSSKHWMQHSVIPKLKKKTCIDTNKCVIGVVKNK